jgi:hypothetical protein
VSAPAYLVELLADRTRLRRALAATTGGAMTDDAPALLRCPRCSSADLVYALRDPAHTSVNVPPPSSYGEFAECRECGHEWKLPPGTYPEEEHDQLDE